MLASNTGGIRGQLHTVRSVQTKLQRTAYGFSNTSSCAQHKTALQDVSGPGRADDSWFEKHWSVDYWRLRGFRKQEETTDLRELASVAARSARQANVLQDTTSAAYWTYHTARWAFFLGQAGASVIFMSARTGDLARGKINFVRGSMDAADSTQLAWVRLVLEHHDSSTL